jgi:hypothetical protein
MARSKSQMTHAKRDRERARLDKRIRKQEKKDARRRAASAGGGPPPANAWTRRLTETGR